MTDTAPSAVPVDRLPLVVCDADGQTAFVSPPAASIAGLDDASRVPSLGTLVHPADADDVASALVDAGASGEETTVAFRPRGEPTARRLAATVFPPGRGDRSFVVYLRDVTLERGFADALESLVDPTTGVVTAGSRRDVVGRVLDAVDEIPSLAAGCYLLDRDAAVLRPVRGVAGDPNGVPKPVSTAFRSGAITPIDGRTFPVGPLDVDDVSGGVAIPLGDHGVLVAGVPATRRATTATLDFLALVAFLAALSLDRLADRRATRRFRRDLERCGTALDRVESVDSAVRRAERRATAAESAGAVQRAVCESLVALDGIAFVRFDDLDAEGNTVVPAASAGEGDGHVDGIRIRSAPDAPPTARAVTEGDTVAVPDVAAGLESAGWRREAIAAGFRSILAVPVTAGDTTCGVITVYGSDADALDDAVETGVAHLGRTVGYVLRTLGLRSVALGASTVELVLSIPDAETPLARIAAEAGTEVRFESAASTAGPSLTLFLTADAPPDDLLGAIDRVPGVDEITALGRDDGAWLYETVVVGRSVPATLASLGAVVVAVRSNGRTVQATVALPRSTDVRSFVDSVREVHPDAELLARRTRDHPVRHGRGFREEVDHRLTDRQREILSAAYAGGYFEWPRDRSGSEIAAGLDISQPTFARHLRAAEHKLLDLLFEDDDRRG